MDGSPLAALPVWVRKRDGRTVPFDADALNRTLFAATERLGRPDPFAARELTDSVLHFLASEYESPIIDAGDLADILVKVVRELGQLDLARCLTADEEPPATDEHVPAPPTLGPERTQVWRWLAEGPQDLQQRCADEVLRQFSLSEVFARHLVMAHHEGLLVLDGLEHPLQLAAAVVSFAGDDRHPFERIEQAGSYIGQTIVLDAPERALTQHRATVEDVSAWVRELRLAARTLGVEVLLNLGSEVAPGAAEESPGPLFATAARAGNGEGWPDHLDALLEAALAPESAGRLTVHWHLTPRDFASEAGQRRLLQLARLALSGAPLTFVCDRPRRPISLGEGLDREHPAILQWVGLDLLRLRQRREEEGPERFLDRLASLVRLAVSAGVQKRDFLRRQAQPDWPAFVLERAHLGVYVSGLPVVTHAFVHDLAWESEAAAGFTQQVLERVQATLDEQARRVHLAGILDTPPPRLGQREWLTLDDGPTSKQRVRLAGRLHAALGRGTMILPGGDDMALELAQLIDLLQQAWKPTDLCRLRLRPSSR